MLRFLHRQNNGSYPLTLLTKEAEQMDLISSEYVNFVVVCFLFT